MHKLLYYHRKHALLVLRRVTARTKQVRLAARKVAFRKRRRTLLGIWYNMHLKSEKSRGLVGLTNLLWEKDSKRALRLSFRHWFDYITQQAEVPPSPHYFDEEAAEDMSLLLDNLDQPNHSHVSENSESHDHDERSSTIQTTGFLTNTLVPRHPVNEKTEPQKKSFIKFRGRLLTREVVELVRLEHRVDEKYKALAGRYHCRKVTRYAWKTWRGRNMRNRLLHLRSDFVRRAHVKLSKVRHWSVMLAMWMKSLIAKRREANKDRGISTLDTEKGRLLRECATFRQQISHHQERSQYLGEKHSLVAEALDMAKSNLQDTQHSLSHLRTKSDKTKAEITRLEEEAQTIRIMAEGLESPDDTMQQEVDKELKSMLQHEEEVRERNTKMLLDVETNYGRAVQVKLDAQREQVRLHADAEALLEVTRAQTNELMELEQRLEGLRSDKESDEARIVEYSKGTRTAGRGRHE